MSLLQSGNGTNKDLERILGFQTKNLFISGDLRPEIRNLVRFVVPL